MRKNWWEPTSHQESSGFLVSDWDNYRPRCQRILGTRVGKKIFLYPESSGSLVNGWSPRENLLYWNFCRKSKVKNASEMAEPLKGKQSKIFYFISIPPESLHATSRLSKTLRTLGTGLKKTKQVKRPIHKNFKHVIAIEWIDCHTLGRKKVKSFGFRIFQSPILCDLHMT